MQARMTLEKKNNNTWGEQNGSNIRKDVVKRVAKGMENHTKSTYWDLQITKPHWCDCLLQALWNYDTSPLDAVHTQINTVLHIIITMCWFSCAQNMLLHDLNHAYLSCFTHTSPLTLFQFLNLQTHHWCGNRNPDTHINYKFIAFNICDDIKMRTRYNINE